MSKHPASETSIYCSLVPGGSPQMRPASAASLTIDDPARVPPPGRLLVCGSDAAHHPSSGTASVMGDKMEK